MNETDSKIQKIIFRNGPETKFELVRGNILEVKQTYDGLVVNLKDGLHIQLTDMHMPLETKIQITESFNKMTKGNTELTIDFKNYSRPTSIRVI